MNTTSLQANPPTRMQRIGKWLPGVNAMRHYQRAWLMPSWLVCQRLLAYTQRSFAWSLMHFSVHQHTWCWVLIRRPDR
ncbi:MAG: hypothetical protein WBD62_06730 [Anaerolineales bacterium]|nr:hypothetical protein [Anaerolineales bacterium]